MDDLRPSQYLIDTAKRDIRARYLSIHKCLFSGIYDHAGKMRDYNISKKEWVLDGTGP